MVFVWHHQSLVLLSCLQVSYSLHCSNFLPTNFILTEPLPSIRLSCLSTGIQQQCARCQREFDPQFPSECKVTHNPIFPFLMLGFLIVNIISLKMSNPTNSINTLTLTLTHTFLLFDVRLNIRTNVVRHNGMAPKCRGKNVPSAAKRSIST